MTENNPYIAPIEAADGSHADQANQSLLVIAKSTFLAWEKLRLIYIAFLVVLTLGIAVSSQPLSPNQFVELMAAIVMGGVFANVCYFLGPVAETYVAWLGFPSRLLRYVVFATGTIIASVLAAVTLFSILVK